MRTDDDDVRAPGGGERTPAEAATSVSAASSTSHGGGEMTSVRPKGQPSVQQQQQREQQRQQQREATRHTRGGGVSRGRGGGSSDTQQNSNRHNNKQQQHNIPSVPRFNAGTPRPTVQRRVTILEAPTVQRRDTSTTSKAAHGSTPGCQESPTKSNASLDEGSLEDRRPSSRYFAETEEGGAGATKVTETLLRCGSLARPTSPRCQPHRQAARVPTHPTLSMACGGSAD